MRLPPPRAGLSVRAECSRSSGRPTQCWPLCPGPGSNMTHSGSDCVLIEFITLYTWNRASCLLGSNFSPSGFSCTRPCFEKTLRSCDSVSWRPWWRSFRLWDCWSCSAGTELMALLRTSATSSRSCNISLDITNCQHNPELYNLAKSLNTKNFRVCHLFVHSVPEVLEVCQTSSIFVQQVRVLLLHLGQFLL